LLKGGNGDLHARSDFAWRDGGVAEGFSVADGTVGLGAEEADVPVSGSRLHHSSGNTGEGVRNQSALKNENILGNGMLTPDSGKRDLTEAAASPVEAEDILLQIEAVSSGVMKNDAVETVPHATRSQKGELGFSLMDPSGNGPGHAVADAAAYAAARIFFGADDSVSASSANLALQVASQLPENVLKSSSRVRINLYPESLGGVDLDIVVREDRVHVLISAERTDVVQSLHGHQEQLKNALQSQGLQVGSLDFQWRENPAAMGDGSGSRNFWRRQDQENGPRGGKNDESPVIAARLGALSGKTLPIQAGERTISLFV
jgi:flagellar hook-length control protein FliK